MTGIEGITPIASRGGTHTRRMGPEAAAREFESMIIQQWLKAARDAGQALGAESEVTGADSYQEFAEQHLAKTLSERGSFGFAKLLMKELVPQQPTASEAVDE